MSQDPCIEIGCILLAVADYLGWVSNPVVPGIFCLHLFIHVSLTEYHLLKAGSVRNIGGEMIIL